MRARRRRSPRAGFTLLELLVVLAIVGILSSAAIPRFGTAFEGARVDQATATLRSVWHAQRMWWLEHGRFAEDIASLADARLIESGVLAVEHPFRYRIARADATSWRAEAVRGGGGYWSGTLIVDQTGRVRGHTANEEGRHVAPPKR